MKDIEHRTRIFAGTRMGKELVRVEDEFGAIVVTQRGDKRVLSFGSSMEQSSVYMSKPYYLAHEYTQVMLLGMIFVEAKHVTLLGLGGGSLVNCLSHYFKDLTIQVVELRQAVIDIAYQWFELPQDPRIIIQQGDAQQYLMQTYPASTDLILSDLYEAIAMSELQMHEQYIQSCHDALNEHGCLILNLHTEPEAELSLMRILFQIFEHIYECHDASGNWVLFCQKNPDSPATEVLKKRSESLVEKVRMPLMYYYRNLKVIK